MIARLRTKLGDEGLGARAIRSTMFSVVGFGGENLLRLAGNLVLTRLLFPEAFGLMALITVVMTGLQMFSDIGLKPSVVQHERGADPAFLNTAWTLQIIRGVLLWVILWLAAAPIAEFYGDARLAEMLPIAGIAAVTMGFASTRLLTASRELQLGRVTVLTLATQAVGLIVTVALAFWLESVWALVIGGLVSPTLLALFSHVVLTGNRDRLGFEWEAARQMIGFGFYIFFATVAGFLVNQGDRAILGKFVSLEELALYNIAFFLASVPLLLNQKLVDAVVFPLYSRKPPGESADNRRNIFKARRMITALSIFPALALGAIGNWLIIFLYDARYEGAGPLMVLIAVAQIPSILTATYDSLALAAGHSRRFALIIIVDALIRTVLVLVMTSAYGVVGAALATIPAAFLHYPFLVAMIRRYDGWDPLHDIGYLALWAVLSAGVVWLNWDALMPLWTAAGF